MFHITIAWAGLEKRTLSERTRAGMERAREEGKQLGRPRRRPLAGDPRFPKVSALVRAGTLTRAEAARRCGSATRRSRLRYKVQPTARLETAAAMPDSTHERHQPDPAGQVASEMGVLQQARRTNSTSQAQAALPKGSFSEGRRRRLSPLWTEVAHVLAGVDRIPTQGPLAQRGDRGRMPENS